MSLSPRPALNSLHRISSSYMCEVPPSASSALDFVLILSFFPVVLIETVCVCDVGFFGYMVQRVNNNENDSEQNIRRGNFDYLSNAVDGNGYSFASVDRRGRNLESHHIQSEPTSTDKKFGDIRIVFSACPLGTHPGEKPCACLLGFYYL